MGGSFKGEEGMSEQEAREVKEAKERKASPLKG